MTSTQRETERKRLDTALVARGGSRSKESEWIALEADRDAGVEVGALAELVLSRRAIDKGDRPLRARGDGAVMASAQRRAEALAPWAARLAEVDSSPVVAWRFAHLCGPDGDADEPTMIRPAKVDAWIHARWAEAPVGGWLPPGDPNGALQRNGVPLAWLRRRQVQQWNAPAGHVLAELGEVAAWCSRAYSWADHDAVAFILTGEVPVPEMVSARLELRDASPRLRRVDPRPAGVGQVQGDQLGDAGGLRVDAFARVVAELDPTLTVEQVAAWWTEVRSEVGLDGWKGNGERADELARWSATASGSLAELLAAWNAQAPARWRESDRGNLRTRLVRSVRNLLESGLR